MFAGVKNEQQINDLWAYIKQFELKRQHQKIAGLREESLANKTVSADDLRRSNDAAVALRETASILI